MYIADLHIHSRYAYATSKDCTPEMLDFWARRKGIDLLGTGDFTHPAWRAELKEKLEPAGNGFYRLKEAYRIRSSEASDSREVWFVPFIKRMEKPGKFTAWSFFPAWKRRIKFRPGFRTLGIFTLTAGRFWDLDAGIFWN